MSTYIPENGIHCERCHEIFYRYTYITDVIDADRKDKLSSDALKGNVNRVECPFCKTEFTYEGPLLLFSNTACAAALSACKFAPTEVGNFNLALKMSKATHWKLRKCIFAMFNCEKMRIFKSNLCDGKIEILKYMYFKEYRDMDFRDYYIVFQKHENNTLYFTKNDDVDNVLKEYTIDFEKYTNISDIDIPCGQWMTIDRDWAKKQLEE